jgi:hypothetical protein
MVFCERLRISPKLSAWYPTTPRMRSSGSPETTLRGANQTTTKPVAATTGRVRVREVSGVSAGKLTEPIARLVTAMR